MIIRERDVWGRDYWVGAATGPWQDLRYDHVNGWLSLHTGFWR